MKTTTCRKHNWVFHGLYRIIGRPDQEGEFRCTSCGIIQQRRIASSGKTYIHRYRTLGEAK